MSENHHTISIIVSNPRHLAALNRQRWEEEEAAGLYKKGKKV